MDQQILDEDIEKSGGFRSWLEDRYGEALIILKAHWMMQPRVPGGQAGAGQWTKYSGHATPGLKSMEQKIKNYVKNGSDNQKKFWGPKYDKVQQALKKPSPAAALAALNAIPDGKNKEMQAYLQEAKQSAQNAINSSTIQQATAVSPGVTPKAPAGKPTLSDFHTVVGSAAAAMGYKYDPDTGIPGILGGKAGLVYTDLQSAYASGNLKDLQDFAVGPSAFSSSGNKALAVVAYNTIAAQNGGTPLNPASMFAGDSAGLSFYNAAAAQAGLPPAAAAPAVPLPPASPAAAAALAAQAQGAGVAPTDLSKNRSVLSLQNPETLNPSWVPDGGQQGSNPGGWYKDPATGERFYVKTAKSEKHARVEVMSNALYAQAGAISPEVRLGRNAQGDWLVISPQLQGAQSLSQGSAALVGANANFAAHAWLANRDAIGLSYDNQMKMPNGYTATVDAGGTMMFRAQGGTKPFDGDPVEMVGLRTASTNPQAASVFGAEDPTSVAFRQMSAQRLANVDMNKVNQIVSASGLPLAERKAILDNLAERRQTILGAAQMAGVPNVTASISASNIPPAYASAFANAAGPPLKNTFSGPSAAASATTAAIQAASPINPGETVSMFRFVEAGYGESPYRTELANAPRIQPTAFPTAAQFKPSAAETNAVSDYQSSSSDWHDYHRKGGQNLSSSQRANIKNMTPVMDAFLARSRMPEHGYIVRAINIPTQDYDRFIASVGREFVDPGYVGGSHAKGSYAGGVNGGQTIRINVPKGAPAAFLRQQANTGQFAGEGEVLLQRNSRFRIVSASRRPSDGRLMMELDWLGVDPALP